MEDLFKNAKSGDMVLVTYDDDVWRNRLKFVQEVTANHVIIQGGMRFRKHDGSAVIPENKAYIKKM